jgi:hypothetical protein
MNKLFRPVFDDDPAAYPKTSVVGAQSKNTFASLIDTNYIRGEIRIMDKYQGGYWVSTA